MLLPIGRDDAEIRRHAWVCYVIFALNILMFVGVSVAEREAMKRATAEWQEAIEYQEEHPYLKTPQAMERLIGSAGMSYLESRSRNYGAVPLDRMKIEQRELDEQTAEAEAARRDQPKVRLGYVPSDGNFFTIFTSIFVHAGFMHLIGNLLYLFLSGPFVEDVYGRPLFALLYFGGGIAATLTYGANNASSIIPLVGASGAIAAVMGAYLVRFARSKVEFLFMPLIFRPSWHYRFALPAFVVLPLWFAQQLLGMRVEAASGVGFSAHVGGFVFGLVFALLIMITKIEDKWVNPAVLQQTTWSLDDRLVRAMDARHRGDVDGAKRELGSVLRDGNASVEALQLSVDLARDADDPAAFDAAAARLLARHVEQKEAALATE
ncbi:MAG TPA: rhomboid family intramembrane serine protease, partial [Thermoanaerobaculia bacterium]